MATMIFPLVSSLFANCIAAQTIAPEDIPTGIPS